MISPVRATAVVGLGSVVSLAAGVIAAKVLALVIGPEGVGLLGVLQSLLGIAVLVGGLGISTGLVRALAAAGTNGDAERAVALRWAAEVGGLMTAAAGLLLLVALREPVAVAFLGGSGHETDVVFIGAALLFTVLAGVELGIINGYQRLGVLTVAAVTSALLAQGIMIVAVVAWGARGIAPALMASSATASLIAYAFRTRAIGVTARLADWGRVRRTAVDLVRFGVPVTGSALVGTGAQLLVPILVLHQLGQAQVGYYRAAATISVGYLAFLLTSFAQDYYPRVAAARTDQLLELIDQRIRLVLALAVPVIMATLALAPLAIRILYSAQFLPATDVLEWQLVGDLLRLPAWTMALVILARGSSVRFFMVELAGGATLVLGTWVGTAWLGLPGAGLAYLVTYAIYYPVVLLVVRRFAPVTPGRVQLAALALAALSLGLLALPMEFIVLRTAVFLGLSLGMALLAWPRMWRLHREGAL